MQRGPRLNVDVLAGLLFVALGASFLFFAVQLPPGPPRRLGPGSFPTLIASLMIAVGACVVVAGLFRRDAVALNLDWKKLAIIASSLIAFSLLLRGAGLVTATVVLVMIASLAHPALDWKRALALGVGLGVFSSLLFVGLLRMPVAAVGPLFSFLWLGG
jgi:hypothetical protein